MEGHISSDRQAAGAVPGQSGADSVNERTDELKPRLDFMIAQNNSVVAQTQFADAKAAGLMTLMGLLALRGPIKLDSTMLDDPVGLIALGMMAMAVLCCLWAVIPRFPNGRARDKLVTINHFSWVGLAAPHWSAEEHLAFVRDCRKSELLESMATNNIGVSRVLLRKFQAMRTAFFFAIGAVLIVIARAAEKAVGG